MVANWKTDRTISTFGATPSLLDKPGACQWKASCLETSTLKFDSSPNSPAGSQACLAVVWPGLNDRKTKTRQPSWWVVMVFRLKKAELLSHLEDWIGRWNSPWSINSSVVFRRQALFATAWWDRRGGRLSLFFHWLKALTIDWTWNTLALWCFNLCYIKKKKQ